jgi:lipopolysaccharide export system protein LptA
LDDKSGITQYKGNAILTQGTLKITGDVITFYYDQNKQITKAIAQGNFSTYQQVQKPGEEPVRARALQMEYHAGSQKNLPDW